MTASRGLPGVAAVCLLAWTVAANGADEAGRFSVKGVGLASCQDYLNAVQARSPLYRQFGGFISGFVTSQNQSRADTFDLAPFETTDTLAAYVAQACRRQPKGTFFAALSQVARALDDGRLVSGAPRVALPGQQGQFHQTVADRVLGRLRALDHLGEAPPDATALAAAVAAFQRARGLDTTGILDQTTLVALLRQSGEEQ